MSTPAQLRESYLAFFEERGHSRHPSDNLVPHGDPTLLFTGAGMNQFKAMFLGKGTLPFSRATTTQKCMRMPDLENVGRTPSHHTFFEMLGNFSFGDYFKPDAITWAAELLDSWGVPRDRLAVTIYQDDDEAEALWRDGVGMPGDRIFREGEADNFWPASAPSKGPNGICGPCSEIYFDLYPERGGMPPEGPTVDGGRFVEIWNLVFTQYDRQSDGVLEPLPQKNIDTGMGFERAVRVVESLAAGRTLESNFETSLFTPAMAAIHEHVGKQTTFGTKEGVHARRMADHVRAASFCIADGVQPSNLKQGYVVRKVLRRAMIDRHMLGADLREPWLCELAGTFADTLGEAWPDLREARSMIASTIAAEEEKFASTFYSASQRLAVLADKTKGRGESELAGAEAFLLYDTFGLPLDLQLLLLDEHGLGVDEETYHAAMAAQRSRSRDASKISGEVIGGLIKSLGSPLPQTEFVRNTLSVEGARIVDLILDPEAPEDGEERVLVVLDRTPFYAEGGGQVGDRGVIGGEGFRIEVGDTLAMQGVHVHHGVVVEGQPGKGDTCQATVDRGSRWATARNHTATHLLHASLRAVLGDEVTQAGSLVDPDRLRFDFRFPRALTSAELVAIEDMVNDWVLQNESVHTELMGRDDAREAGAMALFGEKYGETVRVVSVPNARADQSVELCGGTHVTQSGDIGLIRIVSESSIAAGIRRMEAVTGQGLIEHVRGEGETLRRAAGLFKASPEQLEERISAAQAEVKDLRRNLEDLQGQQAEGTLEQGKREWNGLTVLVAPVTGVPVKSLRDTAGKALKQGLDLVLLAVPEESSTSYLAAVGARAQDQGLRADAFVKALAVALNGKGGGNASFAQGRGEASADVAGLLESTLEEVASTRS